MRNKGLPAIILLLAAGCAAGDGEASARLGAIVPSEPQQQFEEAASLGSSLANWTGLHETLDFFNPRNLARNWSPLLVQTLGDECARDVARYLNGLRRQELWAIKMDDASGRYTSGFYWGNSYFTGSATECEFISKGVFAGSSSAPYSADEVSEAEEFITEPHKKRPQAGFSVQQQQQQQQPTRQGAMNDRPPFSLGFYMLRIAVNVTLPPANRVLHLGVCLPYSCTAADVAVIAKLASSDVAGRQSHVEKVRDQRDYYDMYADSVFWILFGVSTAVLFLLIAGTSYDVYLMKKIARKRSVSYDMEKQMKLEQLTNAKIHHNAESVITAVPPVNNNNDHEGNLRPPTPDFQKLNVWEELLLSFSIRANFRVICEGEVGRDTISTVHGLRAISMAWVILGHTCIIVFKYSDNMEYRKIVEKRFLFQTIQNGAFSVDTFFFMGGLLVSFLYFRTNAKGDLNRLTQGTRGFVAGFLKFLGFLAYRFCRLTAPYMFVLGITEISMKWFHANSVFEPPTADHYNCPNYWWRNLLYINTLYPVEQMCMLWSWYIADDTQFYIVGAVILIVATNHFKIAAFSLVLLTVSSWITTGYIALVNNHMPNTDDPLALFDKIYDKPWTRLGPYLIGMSVGYFLFKTDCKIKMSKATVFLGWLLSSACLLSLLYGLYEVEISPATGAAYSSLSHSAWALSLAWIVIACSTGYGGYVNDILSAPILYPFSRVTYCAYLVHPIVIRLTAMNMDSPLHLGKDSMVITFFGQVVASYILSFVISISFEAPVVSMLKILSPKKRNRIQ
ncbi:PREDICTED: nose resistant to fluoxetine protein 6-like isoform X3 [Ceratosolen solmsi marchali]|uniref:Nose resistant to fluoxetine protein 6-like isoform X3 n=1 Tax=Ceratosolen solmsi marchali TaxID=326594 RepID=A0AAJ6YY18_9HYME|nr:PREDICTED: nose resistant to fluoxetine protein 6-like isoform X3 [Ceratosolen solmsi marchali]